MYDVNELLELALKETGNLNDGEVFLVKELFKGYEWNQIPRKDRLLLGTLFLNHVNTNAVRCNRLRRLLLGSRNIRYMIIQFDSVELKESEENRTNIKITNLSLWRKRWTINSNCYVMPV